MENHLVKMIGDSVLEEMEKKLKDMEAYLKSGGKPVTSADISNMGRCVVDGIKSGIEHNTGGNKETTAVLGVSLKHASESLKSLSIAFPPLGKVKKGGK